MITMLSTPQNDGSLPNLKLNTADVAVAVKELVTGNQPLRMPWFRREAIAIPFT